MSILLAAAVNELELLEMEIQDLQDIIDDPGLPELYKCAATLRLAIFIDGRARLKNAIANELDQQDIGDVLAQIEAAGS